MRLGAAYYPERTPRGQWRGDLQAMAATGLELVRMGEFSWSACEPRRGQFDFGWLDEAVGLAQAAGLDVILCTPTAAPPVWLARERPEILSVGPDLHARPCGSRRHGCPVSPAYRDEAQRITAEYAGRYGRHDAVTAWQLDNEPGNHDSARCWCPRCQAAFVSWLGDRYGSAEELNRAWGTRFWSGDYPALEAVELPRPALTRQSPSLLLAHRRFSSDQMVAFIAQQHATISAASPGRDITSNQYLSDIDVDGAAIARLTSVASHDCYPTALSGPLETALVHDLNLGRAGPGGRSWVMEQPSGPINWTDINHPVPPGQVRIWAWQAALHGAQALLFFPWQACRSGQEQYHAGLHAHDGTPTRALEEARRLARELAGAAPDLLSRPPPSVALLHDFDDAAALEADPHRRGLRHRDLVLAAYSGARRVGLEVDVVAPCDDLARYSWVLAPGLHLSTPERLRSLLRARDSGATVVLGPRSLVKDIDNCWVGAAVPDGLAGELGASVTEHLSQPEAVTVREFAGADAGPWTDVLEPAAGEVLATYGGGTYLDGAAAAVRRNGIAYAGFSSADAWTGLLAALTGRRALPDSVEVFRRGGIEVRIDHRDLSITGLDAPALLRAGAG